MRSFLSLIPVAALGCAPDYVIEPQPVQPGVFNPRPLEPETQIDRIVQMAMPEVDVLWVVDDSCSAYDEQLQLAEQFPAFLKFFDGLDYHVGVVTTDMDDPARKGRLVTADGRRFVDAETPAPATTFAKMCNPGVGGSGIERGNDATYAALHSERGAYNEGFLRDASGVHVIVVSDEYDFSYIEPSELAAFLEGLREDPDHVTHSSIVKEDASYPAVTNLVGGLVMNVFDPDWTPVIEQIGLRAAGLTREFFLSQLPVPGTIQVSVVEGGVKLSFAEGEDWAYRPVRNSVVFHEHVPNAMSEVVLEYRILASDHGD